MHMGSTFHHDTMLSMYEQIAVHAAEMEDAADAGDWDRVTALERECAILVARLRAEDPSVPLEPRQRERKTLLLTQILRSDAYVRSVAQPVMDALQHQIADARRGSQAHQAYGRMARF
ncbi:flagellar protein FliT [Imbroritus primus]|uniref:Flagellar protein FliT n=1 Tax=Imbroritus primus TaxID=3058603 RepID=A0ACD3SU28_9BURK|nr:flagellar protein FliT [Burkholderiaceae bacterium PBA]